MNWKSLSALAVLAAPASAGVVQLRPNTFISHHVVDLKSESPDRAYRHFVRIRRWWSSDHTYTGKLSNLTLNLEAGGCFCEDLPKGGSVEHMRVSLVQPGERLVLTGGLGPLLFQGVAGTMDVRFAKTGAGNTLVTLEYRVAGFAYANAEKVAPLVDKVLTEQIERFAVYARSRQPRSSVTKR